MVREGSGWDAPSLVCCKGGEGRRGVGTLLAWCGVRKGRGWDTPSLVCGEGGVLAWCGVREGRGWDDMVRHSSFLPGSAGCGALPGTSSRRGSWF